LDELLDELLETFGGATSESFNGEVLPGLFHATIASTRSLAYSELISECSSDFVFYGSRAIDATQAPCIYETCITTKHTKSRFHALDEDATHTGLLMPSVVATRRHQGMSR
jgi:hypothetical protein